jgi:serine protease Do
MTYTVEDVAICIQESPASPANIPESMGLSLQEIYEKAIPSVVSISCRSDIGTSSGTGVVISQNGYIVTNCHVVEDAQYLQVLFSDGRQLDASIVGTDTVSDLAVLHVHADDLVAAEFGNSDALRVGDKVVAIGDPLGVELRGTMTDGIVSAINRDITTQGRPMTLIQTNAALNSGNSGGPLINCYGQVIGINTMKIGDYMSSAGVEGLGFAIPSVTVEQIVNQLLSQGYVSGRPDLGLACETVSSFLQIYYNIPQGVYITAVSDGSHAQQLGISAGDIILSFDEVRIADTQTLNSLLYTHNAYDTVPIVIYRAGNQYQLNLTLDEAK